jgi:hypothetical protein
MGLLVKARWSLLVGRVLLLRLLETWRWPALRGLLLVT